MPERRSSPFPPDFLWGAATSAHQVEGDNRASDWWAFEQAGELPFRSGAACRHYQLFEQDFELARAWGHNAHRFSIEWSRIEPREGEWDQGAIDHYREVVLALRRRGLEPLVTLHHFTNPAWFTRAGGWARRDSAARFARYVERIAGALRTRYAGGSRSTSPRSTPKKASCSATGRPSTASTGGGPARCCATWAAPTVSPMTSCIAPGRTPWSVWPTARRWWSPERRRDRSTAWRQACASWSSIACRCAAARRPQSKVRFHRPELLLPEHRLLAGRGRRGAVRARLARGRPERAARVQRHRLGDLARGPEAAARALRLLRRPPADHRERPRDRGRGAAHGVPQRPSSGARRGACRRRPGRRLLLLVADRQLRMVTRHWPAFRPGRHGLRDPATIAAPGRRLFRRGLQKECAAGRRRRRA